MTAQWKRMVTELNRLTKSNASNAWRVAQIIRELSSDVEFMAECGERPDEVESRLRQYSERCGFWPSEMVEMIEAFPDAKDWASGRLCYLRDEAHRLLIQRRSEERREKASQQPSTAAAPNGTKPSTQATVSVSAHERTAPLPVTKGEPKDYTEAVEVIERLREQGQHLQNNSVPRDRYESLRGRYADLEAKYKALQRDHAKLKATVAKMKRNLQAV